MSMPRDIFNVPLRGQVCAGSKGKSAKGVGSLTIIIKEHTIIDDYYSSSSHYPQYSRPGSRLLFTLFFCSYTIFIITGECAQKTETFIIYNRKDPPAETTIYLHSFERPDYWRQWCARECVVKRVRKRRWGERVRPSSEVRSRQQQK